MPTPVNELHLIERFKRGETSLFGQLVLAYQDRVYNLCHHLLHDAQKAEDATQDAFVKAYRNLKNFTPRASFYAWLCRIAVNTCLDVQRKPILETLFRWSAEGEEYLAVELPDELSPERLYESKQMGMILQLCLQKLSPKLRAVILLKEMEGFSYDEIAEVMDISLGTVKSRVSRARTELKSLMEKIMEPK